jgi:GR25 family glycosyltransferase involved in LPS biosynthesis
VQIVDGFVSTDPEVDTLFDHERARSWSKRIPSRAEIAAYATHRLAWKTLLDDGRDFALILEDDFLLRDPALVKTALDGAPALLADGRNLIKLFDFPRDQSSSGIRIEIGTIPLVKWPRTRAGLVGYILSREGAERRLERQKIFRVVDEDIKFFWELGLDIWSVPGNPVIETAGTLGGSLLEEERQKNRKRSPMRSLRGMLLALHRDLLTRLHYIRFCHRYRHCDKRWSQDRPVLATQPLPEG